MWRRHRSRRDVFGDGVNIAARLQEAAELSGSSVPARSAARIPKWIGAGLDTDQNCMMLLTYIVFI